MNEVVHTTCMWREGLSHALSAKPRLVREARTRWSVRLGHGLAVGHGRARARAEAALGIVQLGDGEARGLGLRDRLGIVVELRVRAEFGRRVGRRRRARGQFCDEDRVRVERVAGCGARARAGSDRGVFPGARGSSPFCVRRLRQKKMPTMMAARPTTPQTVPATIAAMFFVLALEDARSPDTELDVVSAAAGCGIQYLWDRHSVPFVIRRRDHQICALNVGQVQHWRHY